MGSPESAFWNSTSSAIRHRIMSLTEERDAALAELAAAKDEVRILTETDDAHAVALEAENGRIKAELFNLQQSQPTRTTGPIIIGGGTVQVGNHGEGVEHRDY
jgi:hypothetical protein